MRWTLIPVPEMQGRPCRMCDVDVSRVYLGAHIRTPPNSYNHLVPILRGYSLEPHHNWSVNHRANLAGRGGKR